MGFYSRWDVNHSEQKKIIRKALNKFGCKSATLSIIGMEQQYCITKEKYVRMYETNQECETREDLSVGEDLETFIENIKSGKINKDTITNLSLIHI